MMCLGASNLYNHGVREKSFVHFQLVDSFIRFLLQLFDSLPVVEFVKDVLVLFYKGQP